MLTISSVFSALLAVILVALSALIIIARNQYGVALFHNEEEVLKRRVRAHGNFIEYSVFFLILFVLVELQNFSSQNSLIIYASVFLFARLLHAASVIWIEPKTLFFRIIAMVLTFSCILRFAFLLLTKSLG